MRADPVNERILVVAPTGRDAELTRSALTSAGFIADACRVVEECCEKMAQGAGGVLVAEEALTIPAMKAISSALAKQLAWSDIPILIFTSQPSAELAAQSLEALGSRANVTLIERPVRVKTLISSVNAALRARRRQYEVRDLLADQQRRIDERDQFLAMLSHELRNPLAAITLAVNPFERGDDNSEHAIILRQTKHLAKLVDDLLDIARVTTGKISLQRRLIDLCDVVEHCVETMMPRAEAHQVRLTAHTGAKRSNVYGDGVRLEQIVNNLLSNAIKYTPAGGDIQVHVVTEGDEVLVRVRDNGKGITPEMLTRIFDMFMQGETTLDRTEGGMGVGLTLVKRLTELHGGNVRARSDGAGSGSEFVVRFPIDRRHLAEPLPATAPTLGDVHRQIVVVEDNRDIRDLLQFKLRQLDHTVQAAEDGPKGLDLILSQRPEVALVDIGLPGLDGYELARRVRQQLGKNIYLIALTGYGQTEDKRKALEAGFDVHLTKPADLLDLQSVIGSIPSRA